MGMQAQSDEGSLRGSESAPPVADEADEERAVSPGLKSLKQVWSRNLPPPVAESGRRRLETARSAFGATMRVSRVGSPTFLIWRSHSG